VGVAALASLVAAASLAVLAGPPGDAALKATLAVAGGCGALALVLAARPQVRLARGADGAIAAGALVTALAVVVGIPDVEGARRRPWLGSARERSYAVSLAHRPAVDLLKAHGAKGRLFTEYHWAAYAIHQLWPDVKVFLDSRSEVHGPKLLEEYLLAKTDAAAARRMLDAHQPDLVLVRHFPLPDPPINLPLLETLAADPEWGLVLVDDESILFARGSALDALPPPLRVFEPLGFAPRGSALEKPGLEGELRTALERSSHSSFLRTALAGVLRSQGRSDEALAELERGWASNPRYAGAPFLAGLVEGERGNREAARRWLRRAVAVAPGWQTPRRALAALEVR
jgi:hypothetical protein